MKLRRGQEITLDIDSLALEGHGVGRLDGLVAFVDNALPGERVRARITRVKRRHVRARSIEVLHAAPERRAARCIHLAVCGGCTWQELEYDAQLAAKTRIVRDSLVHLGGFSEPPVHDILPSPREFEYRNKMEFSFFAEADGGITLGLHTPGTFDRVFDLEHCHLVPAHVSEIVHETRSWCRDTRLPAYHSKRHTGFWRYLVIRDAAVTGETMVNLVTHAGELPEVTAYVEGLTRAWPRVRSMVRNVNSKRATIAVGEHEDVLYGRSWIEERVGDLTFRIHANSFFQTNSLQAERLFATTVEMAQLTGGEMVLDLYAGAGAISLFLARRAAQVTGIELVPEAVRAAEHNARHNGITNCRFVQGEVRTFFKRRAAEAAAAEVVIADPPRAGLHPDVVQALRILQPRRIVYVSCNPATLARDLQGLCEGSRYRLAEVRPVDMFPHTYHVESVARLEREDS